MKTIIVEDEPLVAKDLQKLIGQIDPSIEILCVLDSVESCISYFTSNPEPDLLFMDIQLSDGVSFDLLKQVDIRCPIIFTTAYNEYALRAFKVNSIDYLLKPIDKNELLSALEKFKKVQPPRDTDLNEQIKLAMTQILTKPANKIFKERFMAHSGRSFVVVDHSQVAYFIKDTLIYLVTNDKQQYVTDFQSMEEVEDLLNPKFFFRANRQYIVNIKAVDNFRTDSYSKLIVHLKSPLTTAVDVSREKAQAFKNWIH
jgi:DNA-binding LytR/AlgR family response regulator